MAGIIALLTGYICSQFFRAFLAVLTTPLKTDLMMSDTQLAYASGAWFIAFALCQFPVGILLDTIGPRKTAGYIFTGFCTSGILLFAFASSPLMIIIAMALIGIGCSPALMAPLYIFAKVYSPAKLATLLSTFVAVGSLGNIAGSEPLAATIATYGWRHTAIGLGVLTLIVGAAVLLLCQDVDTSKEENQKGGFLDLLKIKQLWLIFPIILVGYATAAGIRGLWIAPYHADVFGYSELEIGRVTLYMSIALVVGILAYGPLDRIVNSRKWVVFMGSFIVFLICLYAALVSGLSPFQGTMICVLIGFFGGTYGVQMAHGRAFIPSHLTGRGVTLLNFFSIGGAGLFQWLSGPIVERNVVAGNPEAQYQALFAFYAILTGAALLVYLFSKDAKPIIKSST